MEKRWQCRAEGDKANSQNDSPLHTTEHNDRKARGVFFTREFTTCAGRGLQRRVKEGPCVPRGGQLPGDTVARRSSLCGAPRKQARGLRSVWRMWKWPSDAQSPPGLYRAPRTRAGGPWGHSTPNPRGRSLGTVFHRRTIKARADTCFI